MAPTKKSQDVCYWLGRCYERLGDNEGARALYFHYINQIRTAAGEAHPYVIEVREWISKLPEPFNAPNQDREKGYGLTKTALSATNHT